MLVVGAPMSFLLGGAASALAIYHERDSESRGRPGKRPGPVSTRRYALPWPRDNFIVNIAPTLAGARICGGPYTIIPAGKLALKENCNIASFVAVPL